MTSAWKAAVLACALGPMGWAARCTTVMDPAALREYENYLAAAEKAMAARFAAGDLSWVPAGNAKDAAARLASGKAVRWNLSDAALNRRLAAQNGTVLHWIGAIRIRGVSLAGLESVLQDYERFDQFYRPMVFQSRADGRSGQDMILGLHSTFRIASLLPQHYSFRVKARLAIDRTERSILRLHLRSAEIRESDSGVPGRADFLEPYRDHGIMWALNAYWRARTNGDAIYLEFETITLARSVETFACKIGFVPIPKAVIADAMDFLPADSVRVVLEGTRAECERRRFQRREWEAGQ